MKKSSECSGWRVYIVMAFLALCKPSPSWQVASAGTVLFPVCANWLVAHGSRRCVTCLMVLVSRSGGAVFSGNQGHVMSRRGWGALFKGLGIHEAPPVML